MSHFGRKTIWNRSLRTGIGLALLLGASPRTEGAPSGKPPAAAPAPSGQDPCRTGKGQYASGDVLKAIASLERCVERAPRSREGWALLATARLEAGRFDVAADAYGKAHALKAGDAPFLDGYLDALEGAGRRAEQIPVLRALVEAEGGTGPSAERLVSLADSLGGHADDRLFALERLSQGPDAPLHFQEKLAAAYLQKGLREKSQAEYRGLLARRPENGEYWAGLAASLAPEDRNAALECYRKAIFYSNQASARAGYEKQVALLKAAPSKPAAPAPATAVAAAPVAPVAPGKSPEASAKPASASAPMGATAAAPAAKTPTAAPAPVIPPSKSPDAAPSPGSGSVASASASKSSSSAPAPAKAPEKLAPVAAAAQPAPVPAKPFDLKAFQDSVYKAELEKRLSAIRKSNTPSAAVPPPSAPATPGTPAAAPAGSPPAMAVASDQEAAARQAAQAKEAREKQERLANGEKEKQERLAKEEREKQERLAKEEKERQARLAREAEEKAKAEREEKEKREKLARDSSARAEKERLAKVEAERKAREERERVVKDSLAKVEKDRLAKAEAERKAKEERERFVRDSLAKFEKERLAKLEAEKKAREEKERLVRDSLARAEKERLARLEAEKKAKEARDRFVKDSLAQVEKARLAKLEAEGKAREERERFVKDSLSQVEKARLAKLEAERKAREERERFVKDSLAQVEKARLAFEKKAREERERFVRDSLAQAEKLRLAAEKKAREERERFVRDSLAQAEKDRQARLALERQQRRERAVALYRAGRLDSADVLFDTVLAEGPDSVTLFYAGRANLDKGRWSKALKLLGKSPAGMPDRDRFLGRALLRLGEQPEALAAFERHFAQTGDVRSLEDICALKRGGPGAAAFGACLEKLSAKRPQVAQYHADLAVHYQAQGDKGKSLERWSRVLAIEPGHGEANYRLGMDWAGQGVHDRAVPPLEKAVAAFPDRGDAWKALARGQASLGRADAARESWRKAAGLLPRDVEVARGLLALARDEEREAACLAVLKLAPEDREAALGYARLRFRAKDWPAAEKHFRLGIRESRVAAAWGEFGRTLFEVKKPDEAAEALQKAVDLGETDRRIRLDLARTHLARGDADRAEALLRSLATGAPTDPEPWFRLSEVAARRQQVTVQEEHLRKAHLLKRDDPVYAEALGRLLRDRDEFRQAIAVLQPLEASLGTPGKALLADCLAATGEGPRALGLYDALFRKEPSAYLLARRIDVLVRLGKAQEAVEAARGTAFGAAPEVRFSLAKAHLALAESHVLKADLDQAVSLLEGALDDEPHRADFHALLGAVHSRQGKPKKAMSAYTDALKYRVDYPEAVYGKGRCLVDLGRAAEARDFFRELSQHADARWKAKGLMGLARVFETEGKWEAVEHHLSLSITAHPDPDAMAYLSRVHLKLGRFPEAEQWAAKALAAEPGHEAGNVAMAEALAARKKIPEALGLAEAALKLKPLSCDLLVQSARLNLEAGRVDSILTASGKAVEACPQEPMAHFYAGMAHRTAKRPDDAKRHFKSFRKLGGDRKLVPEP